MDENETEKSILARMRTLLALERNYLAEERTILAEFRTGLALSIFGPPTSIITLTAQWELWIVIVIFAIFTSVTVFGLLIIFNARKKHNLIRKNKANIRIREEEIIKCNPELERLLLDCIDPYCNLD